MTKNEDAQDILRNLGLPSPQCNEMSALTLLALANINEEDSWEDADPVRLRIHDILAFMNETYGRNYAENTRETVRRQVIHQFEQARVVDRNPDDPTLPTNSPNTRYALTDQILKVVKSYGTEEWESNLHDFIGDQDTLLEIYQKKRESHMVPVRINSADEILLSPGTHNQLQAEVIHEFAPRFAPDSIVLYLGDTADKMLHIDEKLMQDLGIPVTQHDKLPDVVLYDEGNDRLFLIEAVTSHGPVSPKRHYELEEMMSGCTSAKVYVSTFPDFSEFKKHLEDIAWETEVWLEEIPDHLIHFNGDKFLNQF